MLKRVLGVALGLLCGVGAQAQNRPTSLYTDESKTPQVLQVPDKTGAWVPLGTIGGGVFSIPGVNVSAPIPGASIAAPIDPTKLSPAVPILTPSGTPQALQVLDSSGAQASMGTVDPSAHTWIGPSKEFFVRNYGPFNDWIGDDGPAIAAALSAASAAGGGTVYLDQTSYWNQTAVIQVPINVRLRCIGYFNKQPVNNRDDANRPCSIYQKGNGGIFVKGALTDVGVFKDTVHFNPQITTTRAQLRAFVDGMAGVGVTINWHQALIDNVQIGGFATCLVQSNVAQTRIGGVLGDCTNGFDLSQSGDDNYLNNMEFWEFLSVSHPHVYDTWTISGLADNGAGLWRVTTSTTNDLVTGEKMWIVPGASAFGASGQWTVTVIDSTHFDLQGSNSAPTTTGNVGFFSSTGVGSTYVSVTSTDNLAMGMNVSGSCIPAGATVGAVWRTRKAISLDQAHASTCAMVGTTLTFSSPAFNGSGSPNVFYDGNWRTGVGFAIGRADGTMCNQCFAFGYQIGFNFRDAVSTSFLNAQNDQGGTHLANQNVTPIGLEYTTPTIASYGNIFKGSLITGDGVLVMNNATANGIGGTGNTVEVERLASYSNYATVLENGYGGLTLKNAVSTVGGAMLLDGANTAPPFLVNDRMPSIIPYGSSNTTLPTLYYGQSLLGGTLEQRAPTQIIAQRFSLANTYGPFLDFYSANRPTDEKWWRWHQLGNVSQICLETVDDAYLTIGGNALCVTRTGNSPTGATFNEPVTVQKSALVSNHSSLIVSGDDTNNGGQITMFNSAAGATAPNKYLRVFNNGAFQIVNSAYTAVPFSMTDAGAVTLQSTMNATGYQITGTAGFTGTKTAGACVLTITGGIITNVTGC